MKTPLTFMVKIQTAGTSECDHGYNKLANQIWHLGIAFGQNQTKIIGLILPSNHIFSSHLRIYITCHIPRCQSLQILNQINHVYRQKAFTVHRVLSRLFLSWICLSSAHRRWVMQPQSNCHVDRASNLDSILSDW